MIDITITATRRHKILRRTLESFYKNLFKGYPTRIIINVDPVGEDEDSELSLRECFEFTDNVDWFYPDEPSFPKAFHRAWEAVQSPMVFHLEDDWELLREVDLHEMLQLIATFPELAILRLSGTSAAETTIKAWNKFLDWNGDFFEVKYEDKARIGFSGHPSLIRGSWIKAIHPHLDTVRNPEKQIQDAWRRRNRGLTEEIWKWRYGVFSHPGDPATIKDIGRDWIKTSGFRKEGNRAYFVKWEKINV